MLKLAERILEGLPAGVAVAPVPALDALVERRGRRDRLVQWRTGFTSGSSGDHRHGLGVEWLVVHPGARLPAIESRYRRNYSRRLNRRRIDGWRRYTSSIGPTIRLVLNEPTASNWKAS